MTRNSWWKSIPDPVRGLAIAAALEAVLTIGHFAYGARIYDDPSRYHVVGPIAGALALTFGLAALYVWRPGSITRWLLVGGAGIPFVAVSGSFTGAFFMSRSFWHSCSESPPKI